MNDNKSGEGGSKLSDRASPEPKKGKRKHATEDPSQSAAMSQKEKAEKRREANRRAAAESRQRRLDLIRNLEETAAALSEQIREVKEENEDLRRQLKEALAGKTPAEKNTAETLPSPLPAGFSSLAAVASTQNAFPTDPVALLSENQVGLNSGLDAISILSLLNSQGYSSMHQTAQHQNINIPAILNFSRANPLSANGHGLHTVHHPSIQNQNDVVLRALLQALQGRGFKYDADA